MALKPIIKCPGGKTRLLNLLHSKFPILSDKTVYIEPFLGGSSVLLSLLDQKKVLQENCIVNELNLDIVNTMIVVRDNVVQLLDSLASLSKNISKERFEEVKNIFNTDKPNLTPVDRAAFFIYLNKTVFNGLIRYNKRGYFNSPYGKYKNPCIVNEENMIRVSANIQKVSFYNLDFEAFISLINTKLTQDTFIYLDPPYLPISETSSFAQYTDKGFIKEDHMRLKATLDTLNSKNIKFLMSNSNSILTKEIYNGYNMEELHNSRSISAKAGSRGYVKELLIKNY